MAPGRGIHPGPYGAIDESTARHGRIYVTYVLLEGRKQSEVAVKYSDDSGQTWSERHIVHRTATSSNEEAFQFLPCIAVDKGSGVACTFYLDSRNGRTDPNHQKTEPWVSVSVDGDTWSETSVLTMPFLTDESNSVGINYLEYQGITITDGIIRGVWAGDPNHLVMPSGPNKDILFFEMTASPIFSNTIYDVPLESPTVSSILSNGPAKPGDTIRISGSITDNFTEVANIKVIAAAGVRPTITSQSGAVITVPKWVNTTIAGMDLSGSITGPVVQTNSTPSLSPTDIKLDQCNLTTGGYDQNAVYVNSGSIEMSQCNLISGIGGGAGIYADDASTSLDGVTIYGFTKGIDNSGSNSIDLHDTQIFCTDAGTAINAGSGFVILENCNLYLANGSVGVYLNNSTRNPPNLVDNVSFSGGSIGVSSLNSDLTISNSTFENQVDFGVQATYLNTDPGVHTRIENNIVASTSLSGVGIDLEGAEIDNTLPPTAFVEGNTVDGWSMGIKAHVRQQGPCPPDCGIPPGDDFVLQINRNLVTGFHAIGVGTEGTIAGLNCNDAYSSVGIPYVPSAPTQRSEDPLYCTASLGPSVRERFELRIDSPIALGNPGNSCGERIGALDAGCAWGQLTRNTIFAGTATVLQDLIVPNGKTFELGPGATLKFDDHDESNSGVSGTQYVELTVLSGGALTAMGSPEEEGKVRFTSARQSPQKGDWYGIVIYSPSYLNPVTLSNVEIDYARYGVDVAAGSSPVSSPPNLSIDYCQFRNNLAGGARVTGTGNARILVQHSQFYCPSGSNGLQLSNYGEIAGEITQNTFAGPLFSYANGIKLEGTGQQTISIHENSFSDFTQGNCIEIRTVAGLTGIPEIRGNVFERSHHGIYLTKGSAFIGGEQSEDGNLFDQNGWGLHVNDYGPGTGCRYDIDPPVIVRHNRFKNGTQNQNGSLGGYAVLVARNASVDLDYGYNSFVDNVHWCIYNSTPTCGTVAARGNYFALQGASCNIAAYCATSSAGVDASGYLCVDPNPLSAINVQMQALPAKAQLAISGVERGVSNGNLVIFNLVGEADEIHGEVFDISGRLERDLGTRVYQPGSNRMEWNGRDAFGRTVHTGIHFIRLLSGSGQRASAKVLILRKGE